MAFGTPIQVPLAAAGDRLVPPASLPALPQDPWRALEARQRACQREWQSSAIWIMILLMAPLLWLPGLAAIVASFARMFKEILGDEPLPALTQIAIDASNGLRHFDPVAVLLVVLPVMLGGGWLYWQSRVQQRQWAARRYCFSRAQPGDADLPDSFGWQDHPELVSLLVASSGGKPGPAQWLAAGDLLEINLAASSSEMRGLPAYLMLFNFFVFSAALSWLILGILMPFIKQGSGCLGGC